MIIRVYNSLLRVVGPFLAIGTFLDRQLHGTDHHVRYRAPNQWFTCTFAWTLLIYWSRLHTSILQLTWSLPSCHFLENYCTSEQFYKQILMVRMLITKSPTKAHKETLSRRLTVFQHDNPGPQKRTSKLFLISTTISSHIIVSPFISRPIISTPFIVAPPNRVPAISCAFRRANLRVQGINDCFSQGTRSVGLDTSSRYVFLINLAIFISWNRRTNFLKNVSI